MSWQHMSFISLVSLERADSPTFLGGISHRCPLGLFGERENHLHEVILPW